MDGSKNQAQINIDLLTLLFHTDQLKSPNTAEEVINNENSLQKVPHR